ncbi:hypothetical protein M231_01926 [Tremella mesenterica]|uniref:Uncharacterized protein n=1 Tax=Tremella mesenterica TaxID=5217 RepID=A0A4V1M4M3_TREME|nr:hypothetical protein M231_01926 [Tremella mesenterica]
MTLVPSLPPPLILSHNETLHAIPLPPLAQFLTSLTRPEHLVKLNDILERFRTPKSYHRIDVREVTSSELPPSSPIDAEHASLREENLSRRKNGATAKKNGMKVQTKETEESKREKGEPIILPEGITVEEYKKTHHDSTHTHLGHQNGDGETNGSGEKNGLMMEDQAGPSRQYISSTHPHPPISVSQPVIPDSNPLTDINKTSPNHLLPPSGPKRRIRELRLDIRSLDAAALFTLEGWRREILGLEKLDMEVPDSIWYKASSPSPPPSPPPPPPMAKRRLGRPKKSQSRPKDTSNIISPTKNREELSESQKKEYDDLIASLSNSAVPEEEEGMIEDDTLQKALEELARSEANEIQPEPEPEDEETRMKRMKATEQAFENEGESEKSESPDIILNDLHDSLESADPDFIPPSSISNPSPTKPNSKVTRRSRTSDPGMTVEDVPGKRSKRTRLSLPNLKTVPDLTEDVAVAESETAREKRRRRRTMDGGNERDQEIENQEREEEKLVKRTRKSTAVVELDMVDTEKQAQKRQVHFSESAVARTPSPRESSDEVELDNGEEEDEWDMFRYI